MRLLPSRVPILYLILGVLIALSVVPLYFYGTNVVAISRDRMKTNEMVLQNTITGSLGQDIGERQQSLRAMLANLESAIEIASGGDLADQHVQTPELRALLERFVSSSNDLAYVMLLNTQRKGISAGRISDGMDIFMQRELERAFVAGYQGRAYNGQPLTMGTGRNRRTIFLVSTPVTVGGRFAGLIGAFVDLQFLIDRLEKVSSGGLEAYVVDHDGRLVAAGTQNYSTGQDMTRFDIVKGFLDHTQNQVIATREFTAMIGKHEIDMLGTYNPVPALGWAVIAQKPQSLAYSSVIEMQRTAKWLALAVIAISVCISFLAARRITTPLDTLTESSRAIARGDFTQRVHLKSRTEFGELAETFNIMSADLERFVADLKRAADENLSLFLSSIQMIAGAVDEKDPYTRGHSDRVTRYSILLAKELGLPKEEIEKLRIAAQLHDVGKIGIEDRILKKPGKLTPEEFEIMKTHTTKGANILRPVEKLREMLPGIELHHESLDGRGYPHGLKGDEIPLMPRIIMVADTFDAMTTNRPYQTAMAPDFAVQTIEKLAKSKFDPKVVEALKAVFARGEVPDQRIATLVMAQATVPMDFDPQVETART